MRPGGRLQPAEGFVPLSAVSADYEFVGINLDNRIMVVRSLDHALKDEMQNGAETVGAPFVMMACKERPDARVSLQQGGDLPIIPQRKLPVRRHEGHMGEADHALAPALGAGQLPDHPLPLRFSDRTVVLPAFAAPDLFSESRRAAASAYSGDSFARA